MTQLKDKRVLITGAGHGLGRELAKTLASHGSRVIVTDRDSDRVADTVTTFAKSGLRVWGHAMDVTNVADVATVRDRVAAELGPMDVLVNNAGIVDGGTFENVPLTKHEAIFRVNCLGTVTVTHTFLPDLMARPEAHIVNIASASALMPLPFAATYASSKWAVLGFSESLREELRLTGHEHVRITSVCPGYIATGMFSGVKTPFLMPMLSPQTLTQQIVNAIQSNQELLHTPWQVKLLPFFTSLLPRRLQRWLGDKLGVLDSMQTWHGLNDPPRQAKRDAALLPADAVSVSLSK